jgi:hypothetical protein
MKPTSQLQFGVCTFADIEKAVCWNVVERQALL